MEKNIYKKIFLYAISILLPILLFSQTTKDVKYREINNEKYTYSTINGTTRVIENINNQVVNNNTKISICQNPSFDSLATFSLLNSIKPLFNYSRLNELKEERVNITMAIDRLGVVKEVTFRILRKIENRELTETLLNIEEIYQLEKTIKEMVVFPYKVYGQECQYVISNYIINFDKLLEIK